jgi:hypothetical protein
MTDESLYLIDLNAVVIGDDHHSIIDCASLLPMTFVLLESASATKKINLIFLNRWINFKS